MLSLSVSGDSLCSIISEIQIRSFLGLCPLGDDGEKVDLIVKRLCYFGSG